MMIDTYFQWNIQLVILALISLSQCTIMIKGLQIVDGIYLILNKLTIKPSKPLVENSFKFMCYPCMD